MTYFIYIMLISVNLLFGTKRIFSSLNIIGRNKSRILAMMSFAGCFLLIAGYRNLSGLSSDLINNEYEYVSVSMNNISVYEPGYVLLMKVGSLLSLDFYSWRSLMVVIALLLIFISIFKWSSNPHFVLAFFCGYLVIVSAEQFRNFLGSAVFTYGLVLYLYSGYKHKKIAFTIFTVLAGMIHNLFYIYLLLLLIDNAFNRKAIKYIVFSVLAFCVIIFVNENNIPGINVLLNMLQGSRVTVYVSQNTRLGFAYPMLLHLTNTFLAYYAYKRSQTPREHEGAYKANLMMMICFPLYMLQVSFSRIARNLLVVTYFSEGDYILEGKPSAKKFGYVCLCLLGLAIWFYVNLFILTNPEAVFKPFFENNFFIK